MLKRNLLVLFILAHMVAFNAARADDRTAEVKELMHELQLEQQLKEIYAQELKTMDADKGQWIAQIRKSHPKLDDKALQEQRAAMTAYFHRLANSWSPAEAAHLYENTVIKEIPQDTLKSAVAYYRTPEGQKLVKVLFSASSNIRAYIRQQVQDTRAAASKDYINQTQAILKRQQERQKAANAAHE